MKSKAILRSFLALAGSSLLAMSSANATSRWWDTNSTAAGFGSLDGTWGTNLYWNTVAAGTSATANTTTSLQDDLFFGTATLGYTGGRTITVNGTQNGRLLTFGAASDAITLTGGTIVLGSGVSGIAVEAGAANDATISSNLTINGAQTFTVGTGRTLTLNTGTFTRNAGTTLNIQNSGTLTSIMTGLATGSVVNGIIGPWASHGTGTSTQYATFSGNNIVALTGTAAADGAALTDTSGVVNYDLATFGGTVQATMSANTIRYAGALGTTAPGATLFSVNGLMNAGTGIWTIGANQVTIGVTQELVVNTANAGIIISGAIADNGGGTSTLLKTGSNPLTLSNASNSYTGATTIVAGTISTGTLAPAGSNSGIGAFATAGATGLLLHGGSFTYSGASVTTDRGFTYGTTGSSTGATITVSNASATALTMGDVTINSTGNFAAIGTNSGSSLALGTVTQNSAWSFQGGTIPVSIQSIILGAGGSSLGPSSSSLVTVGDITGTNQNYGLGGASGTITGNIALGTGSLTKSGTGTWTLTGLSSYTGTTTLNGNSPVIINTIKDVSGGNSSLGAPTTAPNGTIAFNGGTLRYIGTGDSSNRVINLGGSVALDMSGTGTLKFTSGLTSSNSDKTLTLTGSTAGIGELAGAIVNNSGTNTTAVAKTGTGTWTLSGNSSYSGGTTLGTNAIGGSGGTLNITHGSALGTGAVSITTNIGNSSFAHLALNSATGITVANNFTTSGEGTASAGIIRNVTGNNEISGTITLASGGGNTRISADGGTLLFSGTIAPSATNRQLILSGSANGTVSGAINDGAGANTLAGLKKEGNGTWTLSSNTNTYTGATTVSNGTLIVNGNISTSILTTVASTATIGGSGTIGALTVSSGGFHNPGNSPGIQNTGNYTNAGTLGIEINGTTVGTTYDQVNTTGSVTLTGLLTLTMGYTPTANQLFFILANDGADAISGTFSNASIDGNTYTLGGQAFQISYFGNQTSPGIGTFTGGNDIALMAIPEPGATLLGSLGMLLLLRRRRSA